MRPADNTDCEEIAKLVYSILQEYNLRPDPDSTDADLKDIEQSYFVGDELKDQMTAINAGCIPIKIGGEPFHTLYDFALRLEEKER